MLHIGSIIMLFLVSYCQGTKAQDENIEKITNYIISVDSSVESKEFQKKQIGFYDDYREQDATILVTVANSEMIAYKDEEQLIKLEVYYDGSHGNLTTTFYCQDEKIVFVRKQLDVYTPPKYENGSRVVKTLINEFYLTDKEIIEFNETGGIIRFNKPNGIDLEQKFAELQQDFNRYIEILYNK
ncbi:MAG: hypothetical protein JPMHGGIA_02823 [Saprospiraceae bacterium]|nr:hypothetical protein [Saprospiraceae bacterium]